MDVQPPPIKVLKSLCRTYVEREFLEEVECLDSARLLVPPSADSPVVWAEFHGFLRSGESVSLQALGVHCWPWTAHADFAWGRVFVGADFSMISREFFALRTHTGRRVVGMDFPDRSAWLMDSGTGALLRRWRCESEVVGIDGLITDSSSDSVLVPYENGTIEQMDILSGRILRTIEVNRGEIVSLLSASDSQLIVRNSENRWIILDSLSGEPVFVTPPVPRNQGFPVQQFVIGRTLLTFVGAVARLYHLADGRAMGTWTRVSHVCMCPRGEGKVFVLLDSELRVIDPVTGDVIAQTGPENPGTRIATGVGEYILVRSPRGNVRALHPDDLRMLWETPCDPLYRLDGVLNSNGYLGLPLEQNRWSLLELATGTRLLDDLVGRPKSDSVVLSSNQEFLFVVEQNRLHRVYLHDGAADKIQETKNPPACHGCCANILWTVHPTENVLRLLDAWSGDPLGILSIPGGIDGVPAACDAGRLFYSCADGSVGQIADDGFEITQILAPDGQSKRIVPMDWGRRLLAIGPERFELVDPDSRSVIASVPRRGPFGFLA